jgi:hypothetical protein
MHKPQTLNVHIFAGMLSQPHRTELTDELQAELHDLSRNHLCKYTVLFSNRLYFILDPREFHFDCGDLKCIRRFAVISFRVITFVSAEQVHWIHRSEGATATIYNATMTWWHPFPQQNLHHQMSILGCCGGAAPTRIKIASTANLGVDRHYGKTRRWQP